MSKEQEGFDLSKIEQKGSSAAYVLSPLLAEKLRKEADLDSRKVQMLKASARKKRRRELNIRPVDPVALKAIYDESANIRRMEKLVKRRKKSIKAGHLVVGFKKATSECTGITVTSTYKKIKGISRIY